jgi:hypothetical protein
MPAEYDLIIHHHLGLGDHLVCNGLVRHYATGRRRVGLCCKPHNMASVAFMYRDLAQLELLSATDDRQAAALLAAVPESARLTIGFEKLDSRDFVEAFYRQAGLARSMRYDGFHVERDPAREEACFQRLVGDRTRYLFLHDDASRGFEIDPRRIESRLPVVRPAGADSIFDYAAIIERATEIHCIDSSFANLVESLPRLAAGRLVLHAYAKPTSTVAFCRHRWEKLGLMPPGLPRRADLRNAYLHLRARWTCWRLGWN